MSATKLTDKVSLVAITLVALLGLIFSAAPAPALAFSPLMAALPSKPRRMASMKPLRNKFPNVGQMSTLVDLLNWPEKGTNVATCF